MQLLLLMFFLGFSTVTLYAKAEGNSFTAKAQKPLEQLKGFTVPEGFIVELVSSEIEGTAKPISLMFDDAGRLWTQTATQYPQDKKPHIWNSKGRDKILVFKNATKRGIQTPHTFANGMVMPVSVLPWGKGCLVAQGPDMLYISDEDGDFKADKKTKLITGFGFQDTHTGIHQLVRTPGSWINFSQGCNCYGTVTQSDGKKCLLTVPSLPVLNQTALTLTSSAPV